ncbi:carboxymuconolactone decarboxylase family protein [Xanthomonas arboricola]|uniref:carboxymuconolactone decarboxylase family protein n=1 Tax=Xanthomonas arboricola TaxID=56448 RepID=UPI000CEF4E24|nr:carboxymuconolactone decarboxylase family protein [Xanthomonas arboricola]PPT57579.1 carboxymuconolactone decarboxylase [Xanthomonas arboricola]PPT70019.1 carboxymuconolactone decarboxylase [Xanthomonas arboricola]
MTTHATLSPRQQAIAPIAAFAATGDIDRLNTALEAGLDAGLSISDCKEVLVQLYAYAGFPRSLNALAALAALMQVVDAREQRGIADAPGHEPGPVPSGDALLALGTANQTRLAGAPVTGPLFAFAPAIDQYLKTHLFGDIFARDNLDWASRELATISVLAALEGVEAQLQSHLKIGLNIGVTEAQLHELAKVLDKRVGAAAGTRAKAALAKARAQ